MARTRGLRKRKNVETAGGSSMEDALNRLAERFGIPHEVEENPV
jgi:hypothetical protein